MTQLYGKAIFGVEFAGDLNQAQGEGHAQKLIEMEEFELWKTPRVFRHTTTEGMQG